jgi:phosphatidate cytidylyltransferase
MRKTFLTSSLFLRIAASIVFVPCFIIITRTGGYHYLALINAVILIGMWEFYRMMEGKELRPYKGIGILCGAALLWYAFVDNGVYGNLFFTLAVVTLMCLELARRPEQMAVAHISSTLLGVVYVGYLGSHLILLREFPLALNMDYSLGSSLVFLAVVVTWAGDTGAYVIGSMIGRHKLLPRVSEKKTREGAAGGLVFAMGAAFVARATFAPYLEVWHAAMLGALAGVVGQLGDLFESLVKRDVEVKDASDMIPGHGGVLDRFDSLLFTAPLVYYFIKFVVFV